jgi:hypothetical protein
MAGDQSKNPAISCVIHHHQNLLECMDVILIGKTYVKEGTDNIS